jgi:hypothetical protein
MKRRRSEAFSSRQLRWLQLISLRDFRALIDTQLVVCNHFSTNLSRLIPRRLLAADASISEYSVQSVRQVARMFLCVSRLNPEPLVIADVHRTSAEIVTP